MKNDAKNLISYENTARSENYHNEIDENQCLDPMISFSCVWAHLAEVIDIMPDKNDPVQANERFC